MPGTAVCSSTWWILIPLKQLKSHWNMWLTYLSSSQQKWQERVRLETPSKVTPKFLCSPGTFLSVVLFPSSQVQLCFKSPTEPEAFFPLAFIDFSWHADVALQTEVLCCGLSEAGGRASVSHSIWTNLSRIKFTFHSWVNLLCGKLGYTTSEGCRLHSTESWHG